MKKEISVLLASTMLVSLAGCSSADKTPAASTKPTQEAVTESEASSDEVIETSGKSIEPVKLTMWSGFTSTDGDIMQDIINGFNETNDYGIEIEMDLMQWNTIDEKLPAAITTNEAPDFVTMSPNRYKNYCKNGYFKDVSEFYTLYDEVNTNIPDNIKNLFSWDGVTVGIPLQVQSYYYYWDKDLFEAAGLDPEKPASTLEEMVEYAKILTDANKNQYGIVIPTNSAPASAMFILNSGGSFTNHDETEALFNSEEVAYAMSMLKDLYDSGCTPTDSTDNTYISGQCGQMINSSWIINGLNENEINYGITTVPAAEGKEQDAYYSMCGWAIPITTTDENKLAAIYEFIAYWNSVDVSKRWYEEAGSLCYNTAAIESYTGEKKELLDVLSAPNQYGHVILTKSGNSLVMSDVLYPSLEEIFINDADIQQTLDKYNDVLTGMLGGIQ